MVAFALFINHKMNKLAEQLKTPDHLPENVPENEVAAMPPIKDENMDEKEPVKHEETAEKDRVEHEDIEEKEQQLKQIDLDRTQLLEELFTKAELAESEKKSVSRKD